MRIMIIFISILIAIALRWMVQDPTYDKLMFT